MKIRDIRSGDLVYWKGEGFWAWLVRFWTRPKFWSWRPAPFFHVGVAWWNGVSLFITDASREGVRCIPFHRDAPSHCQHTHSAWCDATTRLMREMIGKPYSYKTSFLTLFQIAGHGSSAWMCSEYAVKILSTMGWGFGSYQPTPEGLRRSVEDVSGFKVEVIE